MNDYALLANPSEAIHLGSRQARNERVKFQP